MVVKVSEQDQAVVKKAAALMSKSPSLKPTAALQRLGIKSKPRIERLRAALTTKVSSIRKAERKTNGKAQKPTKTAALRVAGKTDVKREALASMPVPHHAEDHDVASFSPIALAVDAQFAFLKNVMRWTPIGVMAQMAISSNAAVWNFALPKRR